MVVLTGIWTTLLTIFNLVGGFLTDRIGRVKQLRMFELFTMHSETDRFHSYWTWGVLGLPDYVRDTNIPLW